MDDEGRIYSYRYDFEYEIQEGDNGQMSIHFAHYQPYDDFDNMATFDPKYAMDSEGYKPNIIADTKAPTGTVTYVTNEDGSVTATVTFDEENVTITNNSGKNTYKFIENGKFTFTFKDQAGNVGSVEAEGTNIKIREPEVKFKTFKIRKEAEKVYVRVGQKVTVENLKADIDNEALMGQTIGMENLTADGELKTGSRITMFGDVQCIVVVCGDVDGDGQITFMEDIIRANNYRLGLIDLQPEERLALDVECDGKIDFIQDLMRINNYRLELINSLDFIYTNNMS